MSDKTTLHVAVDGAAGDKALTLDAVARAASKRLVDLAHEMAPSILMLVTEMGQFDGIEQEVHLTLHDGRCLVLKVSADFFDADFLAAREALSEAEDCA